MGSFPIGLKKLTIRNCCNLEAVSDAMFSDNNIILLEDVSLSNWPNFKNLVNRFNGFQHLSELRISSCHSIEHFPEQGLPASLRSLSIEDCKKLKSLPVNTRTMKCLVSLEIWNCPYLENFPNFDLPLKLSCLRISDLKKLKPLKQWGLHRLSSLSEFSIWGGFEEVEQLGSDDGLFPASLTRFSIGRFPKLVSLGEVLENLKLLRYLTIKHCGNVSDLPSEGVLEKLWRLEIINCSRLSEKCVKDRGEYWCKIAGIPCVEINECWPFST